MMCAPGGAPYQGAFHLRQCDFNPAYYELDPELYAEELSFIGKGTQGEVNLYALCCSRNMYCAILPYNSEHLELSNADHTVRLYLTY